MLLEAAAEIIAETGYEAATMCAIADRAASSIGSLYQFFPNKEAVAEALRASYIGEVQALWAELAVKAEALPAKAIVREIIRAEIGFAERHRAFLALLDAPSTTNSWPRREMIWREIARVLVARNPSLSTNKAVRAGAVVHQIVKGMLALYARAGMKERPAIIREFEAVLLGYVGPKLGANA